MNIGCKDILLSPQPASGYRESSLLRIEGVMSDPRTYYTCRNYDCPDDETVIKRTHSQIFVQDAGFRWHCVSLNLKNLWLRSLFLNLQELVMSHVKKNTIFIATDDIEIYPMSTIKCIVLLNKLKVKIWTAGNCSRHHPGEAAGSVCQKVVLRRAVKTWILFALKSAMELLCQCVSRIARRA